MRGKKFIKMCRSFAGKASARPTQSAALVSWAAAIMMVMPAATPTREKEAAAQGQHDQQGDQQGDSAQHFYILRGIHKIERARNEPKLFIACNMRPCSPRSIPVSGYVLGMRGDTQWIHS